MTHGERPVVVAIIDTGINPYHAAFATGHGHDTSLASPQAVRLAASGTFDERAQLDEPFWSSVAPGTLYHFEGTRLYGITFDEEGELGNILDQNGHGTAVAHTAARAPSVLLVMIQTDVAGIQACTDIVTCTMGPSEANAIEWASDQPWIDIISTSWAFRGQAPPLTEYQHRWVEATRRAVESGKVVISSAGNGGIPSRVAPQAGPPWVISVGGLQDGGEEVESAKGGVDVVANWTEFGAVHDDVEGTREWGGTSFAAPNVAATLADALRILREAGAAPTPRELRDALNASAVHPGLADWRATAILNTSDPLNGLSQASFPVLAQGQIGWGYVDGSLAPEIARRVLEGDLAPPPEKEQAALVQAQHQRAREETWSHLHRAD